MGVIWTPRTRTRQPQGATRLRERYSGALLSAVASSPRLPVKRSGSIAALNSIEGLSVGPGGPAWSVSGTTTQHIEILNAAGVNTGIPIPANSSWTALIHCRVSALLGANHGFFRSDLTASTFFIFQGGSGSGRPWVRVAGNNILFPGAGPAVSVGMDTVFVCSMASGSRVDVAWGGAVRASATHSTSQTAEQVNYFGWQSTFDQSVSGDYYSITWLPWAVSPSEAALLSTQYGYYGEVFAPEKRPVFYSIAGVSPGGGGGGSANRILLLRRPGLSRIWR